MNKTLTIIVLSILLTACHTAKEKADAALSKVGETAAQSASAFAKGVGKGIDEAFNDDYALSDELKAAGLTTGKMMINDSAGHDNLLSAYLIFNKDFSREIFVRVIDKNGLEYGRVKQLVTGKKGDAGFVDFYFGNRTVLESKSKFIFE